MTYVYRVVTQDGEEYWVEESDVILEVFEAVVEVTKYLLTDPEDITNEINRGVIS